MEAAMRLGIMFASAFLLATALFVGSMLTSPPRTEARTAAGINVRELTIKAHLDPSDAYDAN
jgi:hypothetical protein